MVIDLKGKKVFVITNPERGWDCVSGVYVADSEDSLIEYLGDQYDPEIDIIHEQFGVREVFSKSEIRDSKINEVIK